MPIHVRGRQPLREGSSSARHELQSLCCVQTVHSLPPHCSCCLFLQERNKGVFFELEELLVDIFALFCWSDSEPKHILRGFVLSVIISGKRIRQFGASHHLRYGLRLGVRKSASRKLEEYSEDHRDSGVRERCRRDGTNERSKVTEHGASAQEFTFPSRRTRHMVARLFFSLRKCYLLVCLANFAGTRNSNVPGSSVLDSMDVSDGSSAVRGPDNHHGTHSHCLDTQIPPSAIFLLLYGFSISSDVLCTSVVHCKERAALLCYVQSSMYCNCNSVCLHFYA